MTDYDFETAYGVINSAQPYRLKAVADVWHNFAEACRYAATRHESTASGVTEQKGEPYQAFGDRAAPQARWMTRAGTHASTVAESLARMGQVGTAAQFSANQQYVLVMQTDHDVDVDIEEHYDGAMTLGLARRMEAARQRAAQELNGRIAEWSQANAAFAPGPVPTAPGSASGTTATGSDDAGASSSGARTAGGPAVESTNLTPAANGASVGSGDYPQSSVVGPEGGDFAGWVRDPNTGYLVDPATGQEYDPITGRFVDPVTGEPFGEVRQYSSRLEGLPGTGGLLADLPGGIGLVPTGGVSSPNLFGGLVPPSLLMSNPAVAQLSATARNSMAAKAYAASELAQSEARQGGRPYLPPTQAGGPGTGGAVKRTGSRPVAEPASTWTSRPGDRRSYVPPTQATGDRDRQRAKRKRPDLGVEDGSVWSPRTRALNGVLGGTATEREA